MATRTSYLSTENLLKIISGILLISIFCKAILEVRSEFDTWWYHLPFAARLWGIVTPETYIFSDFLQNRYDGFPLFAQFLQGFFWFVTGRPEAAGLVGFLSLLSYFYFLRAYFEIPLYVSAICMFAVPLVQTHATSAFVDLIGNVAASALLMMTYLAYTRQGFINKGNILIMIIAAACAANTKFQLIPVVLLCLILLVIKLMLLWFGDHDKKSKRSRLLLVGILGLALSVLLIFATPIKNMILHGNPFYPIKFELFGKTLNYKEAPDKSEMPGYLIDAHPAKRWIYSILEVGILPLNDGRRWTINQNMDMDPVAYQTGYRMGGFFSAYVVFHLCLFAYLCFRMRTRETWIAIVFLILISSMSSVLPQSHELRYYMYWMITLISLNLYLISRLNSRLNRLGKTVRVLNNQNVTLVSLLALVYIIVLTKGAYVRPRLNNFQGFNTFERLIERKVDPNILNRISDGEQVCLLENVWGSVTDSHGVQPWDFLYASNFHPPLKYSLKLAYSASECGQRKVIND